MVDGESLKYDFAHLTSPCGFGMTDIYFQEYLNGHR